MRVLLTGGAGFIGSHVLDALVKAGHTVVVIDDFNDFYNPHFKEENIAAHKDNKSVTIYRGSITDFDFLENIFKKEKFNIVIHLAARAGVRPSIANPKLYHEVNVGGTKNLLDLCAKYNIKKLIFASSSSVYGTQTKTPFSENDVLAKPISPYAETKLAMERLVAEYQKKYNLNCIGLRFFTVYGERGRPDMAPYMFTEKILRGEPIEKFGDGETKRDYTYITDVVDGVLRAMNIEAAYEIINLGNNKPVSLDEFISLIERLTGKKAVIENLPMQPGDVPRTYADITKAKQLLNWQPITSLEEGMKKFITWYRKQRANS